MNLESLLTFTEKGRRENWETSVYTWAESCISVRPKSAPKPIPKPSAKARTWGQIKSKKKRALRLLLKKPTVRVDTKRPNDIMTSVGELVFVRKSLVRLVFKAKMSRWVKAVSNLVLVTGDLQNAVNETRNAPIKKVFGRSAWSFEHLARSMKKEVILSSWAKITDWIKFSLRR